MKQNRNVSYLNQNKTKLNYVIKFSWIKCSLFITLYDLFLRVTFVQGLFVVGGDFPFTREFDGWQHLIKEILYCMQKSY